MSGKDGISHPLQEEKMDDKTRNDDKTRSEKSGEKSAPLTDKELDGVSGGTTSGGGGIGWSNPGPSPFRPPGT